MKLWVQPQALAGDGAKLAAAELTVEVAPCMAPAADPVSQAATRVLTAHVHALIAVVGHGNAVRTHGAAVLTQVARAFSDIEDTNARNLAAVSTGTSAAAPSPPALPALTAPPAAPVIPPAPAFPAVPAPTLTGEQWSELLHAGPGAASLRTMADQLLARAALIEETADQVRVRASAIEDHWVDGRHHAGTNTYRHSVWMQHSATQARQIAAAANAAADAFDTAKAATPAPQQFERLRSYLAHAQASGDAAVVVSAMQTYAQLQTTALTAATSYQPAAAAAASTVSPPAPAPPIAHGGPGRNAVQAFDNRTIKQSPGDNSGENSAFDGWTEQQKWEAANAIARHGLERHATDFPGMSEHDLAERVYAMMNDPHAWVRNTSRGVGIFDDGTVVWVDTTKRDGDFGTVFAPAQTGPTWGSPFDYFLEKSTDGPPIAVSPPPPGLLPVPDTPPPGISDADGPTLPGWGTFIAPDEAATAGGDIGNLGKALESYYPPDPGDPNNTA